jgi:hypothetical protein
MKRSIVVAALALGGAALPALAAPPSAVTQTRITVGSTEPSPETPMAARHEASAALAEAKRDCRKEPSASERQDCLDAARLDYRNLMESAKSAD